MTTRAEEIHFSGAASPDGSLDFHYDFYNNAGRVCSPFAFSFREGSIFPPLDLFISRLAVSQADLCRETR